MSKKRDLYIFVRKGVRQLLRQQDACGVERQGLLVATDYDTARTANLGRDQVSVALVGSLQGESLGSIIDNEYRTNNIEGVWVMGKKQGDSIPLRFYPIGSNLDKFT